MSRVLYILFLTRSFFSELKNDSATALFQQLPRRLMLGGRLLPRQNRCQLSLPHVCHLLLRGHASRKAVEVRLKIMHNLAWVNKAPQKHQDVKAMLLQIMAIRFEYNHGDLEPKVQSLTQAAEVHYFLAVYSMTETLYRKFFTMAEPK